MGMSNRLKRLPRDVWLVGLISLVNDGASDLVYPLLPLYLSSVLMAGPRALGLIEGVAEATASLLKLVSGVFSDRQHRTRPWIVGGYGLAGLSRPLIALATTWPLVLVLRFSDRVGKGLRSSPRDALLANLVPAEQRGLAFGLHRAMDNAGAVIGPLMAAGLLALHIPLRQIFFWSLIPGLICVLLALALREPSVVVSPSVTPRPTFSWRFTALPVRLQRYLLVVALFTLGNASNLFLLLRARQLGVPEAQIPVLWATVSAVAMLGSAPLAGWSDRVGRRRLLVGGYVAYSLFYLVMGHLQQIGAGIYPFFASYGLFLSATEGVEKALVADLARPEERGTAFGWFNLISGLLLLPASLLFGWLYDGFGAPVAFSVAGTFALLAALMLALQPGSLGSAPQDTDPGH